MVRYIAENDNNALESDKVHPVGYLTLLVNGRASQSIPIREKIALGRDKSNTIVVSDQKVSRNHATLLLEDDVTVVLKDLGSSNGTYVNNLLIKQPVTLQDQDTVRLGDTIFVFSQEKLPPNSLVKEAAPMPESSPPPAKEFYAERTLTPQSSAKLTLQDPRTIWLALGCIMLVIVMLIVIMAFLLGTYIAS